jgi:elongation factor Ts
MMDITASMVKDLREKTDAPMMECKRALTEAVGDMSKAEEILRIKLGNKASKAATRVAVEGVVAIHIAADGKLGAIIEVNCETDFVAKNEDFLALASGLSQLVADKNPADAAALSALEWNGVQVEETRKALVGKIGENVSIRRFMRLEAVGKLASYIHGGAKIGVIVDVDGGAVGLGRDLAMHIAASKPVALAQSEVSAELIEKERIIAAAKAAESGKPANIVEKMVEGSVRKYLQEVTLLGQPYVKGDGKQTVEQLLKSSGATVTSFTLYVVGEGLEMKKDDFADEVQKAVDQAKKINDDGAEAVPDK